MRRQPYLRPIPASLMAIVASFVATPSSAQQISIGVRMTKAVEDGRVAAAIDLRHGEVGYDASHGFRF